jgi:glycosyltransferase involved in cell wall biosynthesis
MSRIILVNQSCGPLFVDIANAIAASINNVHLLTGQINAVQTPLSNKVKIIKSIAYKRNTTLKRLFTWLVFTLHLLAHALFKPKRTVWLISTNPPFAPWLIPLLKLRKQKVVLLIYDLYPEILSAAGILNNNSIIYRLWFHMTQKTFSYSDHIISIGDTMTDYLLGHYHSIEHKITTIPNWNVVRFENIQSVTKTPRFKIERNAEHKLHIVYSGNLGDSHDFNTIIDAAQASQLNSKLVYTIIGEGAQKKALSRTIESKGLKNIVLHGFKSPEDVQDVFLSADVFLVTLGTGVEKASIPSKTYDALAAGAALLVIAPPGSELESMINEGGCGECFVPGDVEGVKNYLEQLANNSELLNRYKNAAKQLSLKYSPENAYKYVEILRKL